MMLDLFNHGSYIGNRPSTTVSGWTRGCGLDPGQAQDFRWKCERLLGCVIVKGVKMVDVSWDIGWPEFPSQKGQEGFVPGRHDVRGGEM
jgi:hypothetical protein